jgi:biotin transport system substrate-specific component
LKGTYIAMAHTLAHPTSSVSTSRVQALAAVESFSRTLPGKAVVVLSASLFVAVAAHCTVPLPFTPVPLTLGDLAVLLVGLFLGPRLAFAALALYLAEGAVGLPVFAPGLPGLAHFFGPTGGYLFAYPFAAAIAGFLARAFRRAPRFAAAGVAAFAASLLIMTSGAAWLGFYLHHSAALTFKLAVLPFLPGQIVKIVSAAGIYSATVIGRRA